MCISAARIVRTGILAVPLLLQGASQWCNRIKPDSVFFMGELLESKASTERYETNDFGGYGPYREASYRVTEAFYGAQEGEILTVLVPGSVGAGGVHFVEAHRSRDGKLRVYDCYSCPIIVGFIGDPPPDDMQSYLRRVRTGHGDPASLAVSTGDWGPSEATTVTISGPISRSVVESPLAGTRFEAIPPGRYTLSASRPGYEVIGQTAAVDVLPGACAYAGLRLEGIHRVFGIVKDAGGSPAKLTVELELPGRTHPRLSAGTDSAGRYSIGRVPPGEYVVMTHPWDTEIATKAGTLLVTAASDNHLDIVLGPRILRTMRFHFEASDGTPLRRASVQAKGLWGSGVTDDSGGWATELVEGARHALQWTVTESLPLFPVGTRKGVFNFTGPMELVPGVGSDDVKVVFPLSTTARTVRFWFSDEIGRPLSGTMLTGSIRELHAPQIMPELRAFTKDQAAWPVRVSVDEPLTVKFRSAEFQSASDDIEVPGGTGPLDIIVVMHPYSN